MDTYTLLRHFADSWALVALTAIFVGIIIWVFRPGAKQIHDDAANVIFRNETKPASEPVRGDDRASGRGAKEA
ncbi:cbb3-type cytochrome c oxidase subunit 3 [Neotabrizicola shimadae]|uniref:Cbb3-type cytochrome c oxidase subunit 3 n=1 Tax=Neotabrizicola shimadae TaxID=2807096 RepID=A0A8G0ZQD1_9RHOB|nr:cbb3-type cytochrome c oxidase subunit 3 [Neotabrizicola shimadae]QYZ68163.1 cbb3-type cytochrome c oxidase subunit 3 [Neotabrizicola shimadae]